MYPDAIEPSKVGTYPGAVAAGGGYVWDAVLEYRVWCHPERGAPDSCDGDDYYCAFATYAEALECSRATPGAEEPIALILQQEYIAEPEPGRYAHVTEERIAEWPVEFLRRPDAPLPRSQTSWRQMHRPTGSTSFEGLPTSDRSA